MPPVTTFVRQPEGRGRVARFAHSLEKKLPWLQRFRTVAELDTALRDFSQRFNSRCIIDRDGYRTPGQHRGELLNEAA